MDIIVFPVGSSVKVITEYNNKIIAVSYEEGPSNFLYLYMKKCSTGNEQSNIGYN